MKIVILTGAGISAESGISTFRDNNGLWEKYDVKEIATKGSLQRNRELVTKFYDDRRTSLADKEPNAAHKKLSEFINNNSDRVEHFTQNVDDLFERAGSNPTHLHGNIKEVTCECCGLTYDIGYKKQNDAFNGKCPSCYSNKVRPNIVMFGEEAPNYTLFRRALNEADAFVVIGTSGNVIAVDLIAENFNNSILNNLDHSDAIDETKFEKVILKPATQAIDEVIDYMENLLKN